MVLDKAGRDDEIRRFVTYLEQHIDVQRVILFGSHAYGSPHEWSDIDVVVISPDFAGQIMLDRLRFLYRMAWQAGTNWIEPLGYTPEELESADHLSLLGEIQERGVVVYDRESKEVFEEVAGAK